MYSRLVVIFLKHPASTASTGELSGNSTVACFFCRFGENQFHLYQGEGPRTKDPISSTAAGAAVSGRPRSTMTTTILYRVLLVVVHLTISLKELLAVICYRMMKLLTSGVCDGEPRSVPAIRHEASRRLRRLPVHLGIVVVEEDLHVVDVVRIVAWSMAVGISYITIYDYKGESFTALHCHVYKHQTSGHQST